MDDAEPEMIWDVFLSHSGGDKAVVRKLRHELGEAGITVWFDEEQITLGDSIPLKVEHGLEHSAVAILCLSSAFLESNWTPAERAVYMYDDPSNTRPSILPILVAPCKLPRNLAHLKRVAYPGEDAVDAVLDALTRPSPRWLQRPLKKKLAWRENIDQYDPENCDTALRDFTDDPYKIVRATRHTIAILDQAVGAARVGLIALDLDGFTHINKRYGIMAAEEVLRSVDAWVKKWCSTSVGRGRFETASAWRGMDEWFVYIGHDETGDATWLNTIADEVTKGLSQIDHSRIAADLYVTACSGVALRLSADETAIHLLRRSLMGLKAAKRNGPRSAVAGPQFVAKARDDRAELEIATEMVSSCNWHMPELTEYGRIWYSVPLPRAVFGRVRNPKYLRLVDSRWDMPNWV